MDLDGAAAKISREVYGERQAPEGWDLLPETSEVAMAARQGDDILIGVPGTQTLGDWGNNLLLVNGLFRMTGRYKNVRRYVEGIREKYPDARIVLAGHSQGGYAARTVAEDLGLESRAYNAPSAVFQPILWHVNNIARADGRRHRSFFTRDVVGATGLLNGGRQRFVRGWGHAVKLFQ